MESGAKSWKRASKSKEDILGIKKKEDRTG